jgi:hypothetical protein
MRRENHGIPILIRSIIAAGPVFGEVMHIRDGM